jgi:Co/Zn/Cd efflux system component
MSAHCGHDHGHSHGHDHGHDAAASSPAYRRVLWVALAVNLGMFSLEIVSGLTAQSVSLLADSLDFLSDASNYGISLIVFGMALRMRARAALVKAACMAAFGLWVAYTTLQHVQGGTMPAAPVMGIVGVLAFAANLGVAALLYRFRNGDSNMRSVWICTRNDAIGNLAVIAAALGVFGAGAGWPDYIVGGVMSGLALWGSVTILRGALGELRQPQAVGSL